jgi:uncharacterized protein YcbK (DUF882 family)
MKNFKIGEFTCPTCGKAQMDGNFLAMLDRARDVAGVPFKINSGYRCEAHNRKIGSREQNCAHTKGRAVDIQAIDSTTRFRIVEAALQVGFSRIGVASTFIHLDNDETKPQCVMWSYD